MDKAEVRFYESRKGPDQRANWYCEKRIKLSLGGMSPLEYSQSKGIQTPNLSTG